MRVLARWPQRNGLGRCRLRSEPHVSRLAVGHARNRCNLDQVQTSQPARIYGSSSAAWIARGTQTGINTGGSVCEDLKNVHRFALKRREAQPFLNAREVRFHQLERLSGTTLRDGLEQQFVFVPAAGWSRRIAVQNHGEVCATKSDRKRLMVSLPATSASIRRSSESRCAISPDRASSPAMRPIH